MRVAVDAMGGDAAPEVVIRGAIGSLKENDDLSILLVGKEKEIRKEFKKNRIDIPERLEIIDALEHVQMREHFFSYWKKREKTSIRKALELINEKKAEAMISAGNTGAIMAMAKEALGNLKPIDRPALALIIPTLTGHTLLVDVGANVNSKPRHLVQFALMGKIFLENVMNIPNPKIALMSIGEEEEKGNELIKTTYQLLKAMDINFIGNVEGRDVFMGEADLIVTDGFTGNIALKVSEGVVDVMMSLLQQEIRSSILARIGFFLLKSSIKRVKKKMDYSEYGGALLLGVNGIVIIGHGSSNEKAIQSAIHMGKRFIKENVLEKITGEIEHMQYRLKEFNDV
ncbi:MAG: phosphate acyltransferase PlsX [Candidatus Omnitrophota bacterium]